MVSSSLADFTRGSTEPFPAQEYGRFNGVMDRSDRSKMVYE